MQVLRSVDTIAEYIRAAGRQRAGMISGRCSGAGSAGRHAVNAFTVDLEEWFHVCGVGGALARRALGRAAVARRADDALAARCCSISANVARRSSSSAGWPNDVRELVKRSGRPATKSDRTATAPRASTSSIVKPFDWIYGRACGRLRAAGCGDVALFRAPEWSVNKRSFWALDDPGRRGVHARRQHGARSRWSGRCDLSAPSASTRRRRPDRSLEVPPLVADRFGQVMPLGWGWGLRMSSPRRVLQAIEQLNRSRASRRADRPSVGARSGPASRSPARRGSRSPITSGWRFSRAACAPF